MSSGPPTPGGVDVDGAAADLATRTPDVDRTAALISGPLTVTCDDRVPTMIELPDFVPYAPVPADVIDEYRDLVPEQLVELWERYGYGTFGDGFMRIVDPREYEAGIGDVLGKVTGQRISIPIMVTGLADVICWEPPGVTAICYRMSDTRGITSTFASMIKLIELDGVEELSETYDWDMFPQAVAAHGAPAFDESFVFVPLLSLGGPKKVGNLKPRKTIEAIRTMVEFQGLIEH